MIERFADGVVVLDTELRIVDANAAVLELTGRAKTDLIGQPFSTLLGDAAEVTFADDGGVAEQGVELRSGVADAETVLARITGRRDDAGTVLSIRPDRSTAGIEIVSTVSHELRSPLTSVKGYTSLLLNRWDRLADDQKKMMLEQVHHDADRVTRLITELLDITRLETGRLVLRREMIDLAALTTAIVDKVGMEYADLDVDIAFDDDVPPVYADPDKLEQVITNLVENACKYASPQGIELRASHDAANEAVVISVSDVGGGIPQDALPKVFTKFFRRNEGRPTGSGLGLWISRGLVEAHGGELTATSAMGRGSTFRFTLPTDAFEDLHGNDSG